ncbi:MAG: hypothetical protein MUE40_07800 [Anaerolineae bacterium]|nr:hypothetical protein [Anaerolineae bacterium]
MKRAGWLVLLLLALLPLRAQDGLNLPAELYVLRNDGVVERYGQGARGVETVTPLETFVLDFRVAPDNTWIAYRTLDGLWLADMYGGTPRRLADNPDVPEVRGRGETLAWSPAADALALTTLGGGRVYFLEAQTVVTLDTPGLQNLLWSPDGRYLAAEAAGGIWWVFRREGTTLPLTSAIPAATGAAWVGLTQLAFTPPEGGLIVMDLASANAQTPLLPADTVYRLPYRESDATLLIFAINPASGGGQLVRVDLAGATPQSAVIGSGETTLDGAAWSPGAAFLVAFQGGALALIDPVSGAGFTLPIASASAYSWGVAAPAQASQLDLPAEGYFLAAGAGSSAVQVWRIARGGGGLPETITPALADIVEYAIAADGRQVAYVSAGALWWYQIGSDDEPLRLLAAGSREPLYPAFSADGRTIYYRDTRGDDSGLWRIQPAGGEATLFVPDTPVRRYRQPRPAGGISALLTTWEETGAGRGIALYDTTSGELLLELLVATETTFFVPPVWLSGADFLFGGTVVRGDVPIVGLHVLDANNLQEPPFTVYPVTAALTVYDVRPVTGRTLRALIQSAAPGPVSLLEIPLDGGAGRIVGSAGFITAPQLAPDGQTLVGYTYPGGQLLARTAGGAQVALSVPLNVSDFRWR